MTKTPILVAALVSAAFVTLKTERASADEPGSTRRLNSLRSDVAVRHRRLLVKNRFEVTPLFESTLNPEFQHIVGGGLKLEYHLSDMISVGGLVIGATQFNTKLTDRIVETLEPMTDNTTREPSVQEFTDRLNQMPVHGGGYISITPWYGKLAAFSTAYVAFDFYFQAGVSFAQLKSAWDVAQCTASSTNNTFCEDPAPGQSSPNRPGGTTDMPAPADNNPNNDNPQNTGSRVGLYLAGGVHVFLNDFLALDLSIRDYAFSDNPSGADYNADLFVGTNQATGEDDNRFLHHLFFGAGISIMFPTKVKRTP